MLNGPVEPLLSMTSSTNRFISMMMTESNTSEMSSKRSKLKKSSLNSTNPTLNSDNRIKFVDMLVCGSCQQDFQLSDIVKFIEHKATCGNKENKQKIPYFLPQQRTQEGDQDDDEDDDDDNDEDENEQSTGSETENHIYRGNVSSAQKASKVLVDASANTLNSNCKRSDRPRSSPLIDRSILAEPYNFHCSQCGDIYSTGKRAERRSSSRRDRCFLVQPGISSNTISAHTA